MLLGERKILLLAKYCQNSDSLVFPFAGKIAAVRATAQTIADRQAPSKVCHCPFALFQFHPAYLGPV